VKVLDRHIEIEFEEYMKENGLLQDRIDRYIFSLETRRKELLTKFQAININDASDISSIFNEVKIKKISRLKMKMFLFPDRSSSFLYVELSESQDKGYDLMIYMSRAKDLPDEVQDIIIKKGLVNKIVETLYSIFKEAIDDGLGRSEHSFKNYSLDEISFGIDLILRETLELEYPLKIKIQ
jgi:hypothetical protein